MSFSATSRRVVRTVAHRNIDWSAPVFRGTPELAAQVNQFRTWVAGADVMTEKYSAPPTPIDFEAAKGKVRDKELVSKLETMYSSATVAPEVYAWDDADKADKLAQIEEAKGRLAETYQMIEDTEKEIGYLKSTRTTRETSVGQMKIVYPDIAAEVEDEIEKRQWFKDTLK